jgi:hypothetical protein
MSVLRAQGRVLARSSNPLHGETGSCVQVIRFANVRAEAAYSNVEILDFLLPLTIRQHNETGAR